MGVDIGQVKAQAGEVPVGTDGALVLCGGVVDGVDDRAVVACQVCGLASGAAAEVEDQRAREGTQYFGARSGLR